ncbi:Photosystem I assembly protein Ycf3 [Zhongshania aliphaticivorans]|uniref:Photosystem I assembly protein Ycf3 n=1 Tax=Zhongshania aliphaticivorans TaxID=1470434 RepID=A0A5S9MXV4_9GAMM|nr:tetratricopeptide repeat protein [Zhongshania aliphaticivorans]CAA0082001.1 Photosystem I assembly protein Ycf3 [Zhongshania aliphaticivorans]
MPVFSKNIIAVAILSSLAACSSVDTISTASINIAPPKSSQIEALLSTEQNKNPIDISLYPEENILELNEQMRQFVHEHVPAALSPRSRLTYLLDSMVRPSQLGLKYDPGITLNAADTFLQRTGNCLSLTSLFIALAREANLNVYYNEVTIPPSWDMITDNSMVFYKHINAVVDFGNDDKEVVDLSVDNYEYHYPQHLVSEQEAAAQFYNNRGAEFMNTGNNDKALLYFQRALYFDPRASHIWGNLGTLLRRKERNVDAETAYRQALTLNPSDQVAMSSLSRLYREQGQKDKARTLEKITERFRKKNPFWLYSRAKAEYETGDFDKALDLIQQAIRLDKKEYRFYRFASLIYFRQGKLVRAQQFSDKASRLKLQSN